MDDEYNTLIGNKMLELVQGPPNVNVIWSMLIFSHKENFDCSFQMRKDLIVGDNKTQKVGTDW